MRIKDSIDKITKSTDNVLKKFEAIDGGVRSAGSKQVIQESKNLEMAIREISGGMNEMAAGADQVNVVITRVNTIGGENKKNIDALVRKVAKFKVE